ncbi:hypothetical protein MARINON1_51653 [Marinobacter salarius]|nr:hypothetical protein MBHK15_111092 [Marinobacter salarius]VXB93498.1 hypothetical protein MARINON1_51653 [Marinobacter salarius]
MQLFNPAAQLGAIPVPMSMAYVHSTILGQFLQNAFSRLVTDVVAVDQEGDFVIVVHLP